MKKILVTGGSGFIGTNAVESFHAAGHEVLNIDIKNPQNASHQCFFKRVDICDWPALSETFRDFEPTHVLHLAARTDLHEKKDLKGYCSNIKGVENMVRAVAEQSSVERCIFTSTKLVCPTDYKPKSMDEYCPNTLYGRSKVEGEKIVKADTSMRCHWCIIRPTSTWGPWSMLEHIPYGKFFVMIANRRYFHPHYTDVPKSFGYVGNCMFQIEKLFTASHEKIHRKVFYISDYDMFTIRNWGDTISMQLHGKKVKTIPAFLVQILAWCGDMMRTCGVKEPPFSSFRMRNMRANTSDVPLESIKQLTGPLPYSLTRAVEETITWLRNYDWI